MKQIPLTKGYTALVDDEDYSRVSAFKWCADVHQDGSVYASASVKKTAGWTSIQLHRTILNLTDPTVQVDHKNHNGLDNQKHNLRACTSTQNHGNMRKTRGSSRYKGVWWNKLTSKWVAEIMVNRRGKWLGSFSSEEDAACAYDDAARLAFGEFALTNF